MRIVNCLHPVMLTINGIKQQVPCGKCIVCQNRHNYQWQKRLITESKNNKYTFFFTLTYNDEFVPKLTKIGNDLVDKSTGFIIANFNYWFYEQLSKENSEVYFKEKDYFERYDEFCYNRISDVSAFFKRIRERMRRKASSETFRYLVTSEFGPLSHRIHYHGLLWTNSDFLANNIREFFVYYWASFSKDRYSDKSEYIRESKCFRTPFCSPERLDVQASFGYAPQYVSKYVARPTSLPLVFRHPQISTRFICSKRPIIGSTISKTKEFELWSQRSCKTIEFNDKSKSFVDVTLPKSFKNRQFPKCSKFSELSFIGRCSQYNILFDLFEKDFKVGLYNKYKLPSFDVFLLQFMYINVLKKDDLIFHPVLNRIFIYKNQKYINKYLVVQNYNGLIYISINQIRNLYYVSLHALKFCYQYELSFFDYVFQIQEFYRENDYELLKLQLQFECDYVECNSVSDLIFLFPNFVLDVINTSYRLNFRRHRHLVLETFGLNMNEFFELATNQKFNYKGDLVKYIDLKYQKMFDTFLKISSKVSCLLDYRHTSDFKNMYVDNCKFYNDKANKVNRNAFLESKKFKNARIYG